MCPASTSVALIAFSHAITTSGGRSSPTGPAAPATMTGATNLRTVGPTAVVTMSAAAISATSSASWLRLLIAR